MIRGVLYVFQLHQELVQFSDTPAQALTSQNHFSSGEVSLNGQHKEDQVMQKRKAKLF